MVFNQPKKLPSLETGMAKPFSSPVPQKTIQPVAQPGVAAPAVNPNLQTWDQLSSKQFDLGQFGNASSGFNNVGLRNSFTNLAKTIGYSGNPLQDTTFTSTYEGESGPVNQQMQGQAVNPELLTALGNYRYSTEDTGDGRVKLGVYDQGGGQVGSYLHGTKDSGFDKFAEKAIPIGIAALGAGAAMGAFGSGAGAAGNGAFLGEGVASGVPAWDAAAGLGAAETGAATGLSLGAAPLPGAEGFAFQNVGAAVPEAVGNGAFLGEGVASGIPQWDIAAGLGSGAEAAPFIAGADSAASGITSAATLPSTVNLANAGGTMGTAGGVTGAIAAALADPSSAAKNVGGSLLDFAKANPGLASLGVGAIGQLAGGSPSLPGLPGSGASGGSSALATALENQIGAMGAPDYSGVPALKSTAGDRNTLNQEAIDAAYSQQTRMLDPQFQRDQQAMEARLAEQGFVPGTPGYQRAMEIFNQSRTDAYGRARDASILQGYQIGQGDFRNALSDAELNNASSREALAQILAKRNQPFNELASVKGNQQIDYNNALDRYNAEAASSNSRNQALSQLALALGMYLG